MARQLQLTMQRILTEDCSKELYQSVQASNFNAFWLLHAICHSCKSFSSGTTQNPTPQIEALMSKILRGLGEKLRCLDTLNLSLLNLTPDLKKRYQYISKERHITALQFRYLCLDEKDEKIAPQTTTNQQIKSLIAVFKMQAIRSKLLSKQRHNIEIFFWWKLTLPALLPCAMFTGLLGALFGSALRCITPGTGFLGDTLREIGSYIYNANIPELVGTGIAIAAVAAVIGMITSLFVIVIVNIIRKHKQQRIIPIGQDINNHTLKSVWPSELKRQIATAEQNVMHAKSLLLQSFETKNPKPAA